MANKQLALAGCCVLIVLGVWTMSITDELESSGPKTAFKAIKKGPPLPRAPRADSHFYDLHSRGWDGHQIDFHRYKGKVVLVVNVASHDLKHTEPNYRQLQQLYTKYKDQGLEILAFPCNQFGGEEAGSDVEVHQFVTQRYKTTFQMMQKVDVNGKDTSPVFKLLKTSFPGQVRWNFASKFLVDKRGRVVLRKRSLPLGLEDEIAQLLNQP